MVASTSASSPAEAPRPVPPGSSCSRRTAVTVLGAAVLAPLAGCGLGGSDGSASASPTLAPGVSVTSWPSTAPPEIPSSLPFSVEGIAGGDPQIVGEETAPTALETLWVFGGDYRMIASLPLDETTVFGSATDDPDALLSYSAALIHDGGFDRITEAVPQTVDPKEYVEPQDGTATDSWIVWRAATVDVEGHNASTVDNWQLWVYDRTAGESRMLVSAAALNGTDQTPAGGAEVVPSTNDASVFFASALRGASRDYERTVLSVPLDGSAHTVVGAGDYPAAISGGVLYASADGADGSADSADNGDKGALLDTLSSWSPDTGATNVLTISSEGGAWGISGVWAAGDRRVIAVSSLEEDGPGGTYLAAWDAEHPEAATWRHTGASSVVGSLNPDWFVWGGGSTMDNADMYAMNWQTQEVHLIGSAPGYSRPCLAPAGGTVLVPTSDGQNPVTWSVASLV